MVENGANIHALIADGCALGWAVAMGNFEVAKYLLENGSNISVLSEEQIAELVGKGVILDGTGSKIMQDAWDKLVQPVKDNKKRVLDHVKIETMQFLLKPDSVRVKILDHQFTYKDDTEEYRYMD